MANWCRNFLTFSGNQEQIEKVVSLFKDMHEKELATEHGQLPSFVSEKTHPAWIFEIEVDDDSDGHLSFSTKYCPNVAVMVLIAETFNVSFEHEYEELGCLVYGKSEYDNGVLFTVDLEREDFDQFSYDEEKDRYLFRSKEYESDTEILETLLEEKIASTKEQMPI